MAPEVIDNRTLHSPYDFKADICKKKKSFQAVNKI